MIGIQCNSKPIANIIPNWSAWKQSDLVLFWSMACPLDESLPASKYTNTEQLVPTLQRKQLGPDIVLMFRATDGSQDGSVSEIFWAGATDKQIPLPG